jgi:hypothetical protein
MLPDFPNLKRKFKEAMSFLLKMRIRSNPLFSRIKEEHFHEGDRWAIKQPDGTVDESYFTEISEKYVIEPKDVIEKGPSAIIQNQLKLAEKMTKKQHELFLRKMQSVTQKSGNVVDAQGRPFTPELFLELLEKVDIDFDDQGRPQLPALFVGPDLAARIKEKLPEWEANLAHKKAFEDLINKKKSQWDDRESNRKLVD